MGLTISQTVTLVSKQIQFTNDIPSTIHRPEWIDAINDDLWTKEDLSTRIEIGLNQAKRELANLLKKSLMSSLRIYKFGG